VSAIASVFLIRLVFSVRPELKFTARPDLSVRLNWGNFGCPFLFVLMYV
jgi:hypothetical protein